MSFAKLKVIIRGLGIGKVALRREAEILNSHQGHWKRKLTRKEVTEKGTTACL